MTNIAMRIVASMVPVSAFAVLALLVGPARGDPPADLAFVNGAVYAVDAARSWASAVAIRDGRIARVGSDDDIRRLVGPRTRIIDLKQRMMLPGFQDSHAHPGLVPNPATHVTLDGLRTRDEIRERIRAFLLAHPGRGWVTGGGWDEAAFLPSGRPTRQLLDDLAPDRPLFLVNNSEHQAWVNSTALAAAAISAATPDPTNGLIVRDAAGEPTGSLQEAALELVRRVIPAPSLAEHVADLRAALHEMNRYGITAVEVALARPADLDAFQMLDRAGILTARVHLCQYFDPLDPDDAGQVRRFVAARARLQSPRLHADCVKVVLDGAYGSHTVALLEPYADDPRYGSGQLFVEPGRLAALVREVDARGFRVHIHAIGDRTVRTALDAIESARRANGYRDTRHTLAHLSLVDVADVPRFRRLGTIANMTPLWSRGDPWEAVFAPQMFGDERARHIYRTRTLLDSGAVLVFGSDWPVTGVSPLDGLETAVTHRYPGGHDPAGAEDAPWNPDERLSLAQAIVAYTAAGAYLFREDAVRGTIEAGKQADLVVLDRNLFDTPPLEIHSVTVDMTILAGRLIYDRRTQPQTRQGVLTLEPM